MYKSLWHRAYGSKNSTMWGLVFVHIHPWAWPGAIGIALTKGCILAYLLPTPNSHLAQVLPSSPSAFSGRAHTIPLSLGPTHPLLAHEARFGFSGKTFIQQPPCSAAAHRPTIAPLTGLPRWGARPQRSHSGNETQAHRKSTWAAAAGSERWGPTQACRHHPLPPRPIAHLLPSHARALRSR